MADTRLSIILASLACLLVIGCAASTESTPSPTGFMSTEPVKTTPDNTSTASTPRPTRTPRPTNTPSPSPTATPDVPLALDGPWLVFHAASARGSSLLWATNSDGTGYTTLVDEPVLTYAIQPGHSLKDKEGVMVAYVTQPEFESRDMTLKLLHLPDRQVQTVTTLINDQDGQPPIENYNVSSAVREDGLKWSPDGQQLAFVAQIDGPSMDVYRYDVGDESIHWLSSGETHAFRLMWSPDQQWVVHQGFTFMGMGGPEIDGMWAAGTDGRGATTLFESAKDPGQISGNLMVYGWQDDTHVLLTHWQYAGDSAIQAVDIQTGEAQTVLKAAFGIAATSPDHDTWLLTSPYEQKTTIPLRLWHDGALTDIPGHNLTQVWWSDLFGKFTGLTEEGRVFTISLSGQVDEMPFPDASVYAPPDIFPSPDGELWAWYVFDVNSQSADLWIGQSGATPALIEKNDVNMNFGQMTWSPDSQRLLVFTDKGLWAAERPDFRWVQVVDGSYTEYWSGYDPHWIK